MPAGVVPLSNNSRRTDIIAMMPDCNAHGPVLNWAEPPVDQVQEFFDTLAERYVHDEPLLIQDTTTAELDYIAARAAEAELAREAGSAGGVEDKVATAAEEKELTQWAESTGEASSTGTRALSLKMWSTSRRRRRSRLSTLRPRGAGESCGEPSSVSRSSPAGLRSCN